MGRLKRWKWAAVVPPVFLFISGWIVTLFCASGGIACSIIALIAILMPLVYCIVPTVVSLTLGERRRTSIRGSGESVFFFIFWLVSAFLTGHMLSDFPNALVNFNAKLVIAIHALAVIVVACFFIYQGKRDSIRNNEPGYLKGTVVFGWNMVVVGSYVRAAVFLLLAFAALFTEAYFLIYRVLAIEALGLSAIVMLGIADGGLFLPLLRRAFRTGFPVFFAFALVNINARPPGFEAALGTALFELSAWLLVKAIINRTQGKRGICR